MIEAIPSAKCTATGSRDDVDCGGARSAMESSSEAASTAAMESSSGAARAAAMESSSVAAGTPAMDRETLGLNSSGARQSKTRSSSPHLPAAMVG
jgi:hypothetical protein